MRRILLLTDTYPFGFGEQFIEKEIGYLAACRGLVVLPRARPAGVRSLPEGVELCLDLVDERCEARRYLAALGCREFWAELARVPSMPLRPRALKKLLSFVAGSSRVRAVLGEKLRAWGANGIVLYSYWLWDAAAAGGRLKRDWPDLRVVARAHGFDVYRERHLGGYIPFDRHFVLGLDQICAVSQDGRDYLERELGPGRVPLRVERLGVEDPGMAARFNPSSLIHVVSCSYITAVKRLDRIVNGLVRLMDVYPGALRWSHLGDGPLRGAIEALARERLPGVETTFLGQVPNASVMAFFRSERIDCFVSQSDFEGVPVSLMEALSFGVPAVARDVGGVREIVTQETGILLTSDSGPEEFAQAVLRVVAGNSAERRAAVRGFWRQRWCAETNYPRFVREVLGCSAA